MQWRALHFAMGIAFCNTPASLPVAVRQAHIRRRLTSSAQTPGALTQHACIGPLAGRLGKRLAL
jgi:hypothetical protein